MNQFKTNYLLLHMLVVACGSLAVFASFHTPTVLAPIINALGVSIIAAGAVGIALWIVVRREDAAANWTKSLAEAGIAWVYPRRAASIRSHYENRTEAGKDALDVIGFGLKDFKRDYLTNLGTMSQRMRIRILIINPESEYAVERDREENQREGTIADEAREFLRAFSELYGAGNDRLQLRTYRCLPLVNVFRIDNEIFWGPYLMDQASGNTFTMRTNSRGFLYQQLRDHFDRVWSDERTEQSPTEQSS